MCFLSVNLVFWALADGITLGCRVNIGGVSGLGAPRNNSLSVLEDNAEKILAGFRAMEPLVAPCRV